MGEPNNALKVYMRRADRIRSVLEYYGCDRCVYEDKGYTKLHKV